MNAFQRMLEEKGITLSSHQLHQFDTYFHCLVEWNEKMNLTAITEKEEVYLKHFYDSLTPAFYNDFEQITSLCDVGSGAGFPSLPLKIIFPHLEISIVDALKKRLTFLDTLVNKLKLEKVSLFHDRAETFGKLQDHRETYDVVTARAVAKLSVLSEFCLPLTKVGGTFIALKGASAETETLEAEKAIHILGGNVTASHQLNLPEEESMRQLVFIKKVSKTPKKYPRKPGTPAKTPL